MEDLKLKYNQEREYVSQNQCHSVRGQINQLIDEKPSAKQLALEMEWIQQEFSQIKQNVQKLNRHHRILTEKGREYRIWILEKKKLS